MGQKSRLDTFPEVKSLLDKLILEGKFTQKEMAEFATDYAKGLGHDVAITEKVVNRYAISFKEMTAEAVETDRLAAVMIKEMGISNQSKVGQATGEMLRVVLFKIIPVLKNVIAGGELDLKEMKDVMVMLNTATASHEKLERSASESEKRRREIEKEAEQKANQKAAEVRAVLKSNGISEEVEQSIQQILLGKAA